MCIILGLAAPEDASFGIIVGEFLLIDAEIETYY